MKPADLLRTLDERRLSDPLRRVCAAHYVTLEDVLSGGRSRSIVAARDACTTLLRGAPYHRSYPEIGNLLGCDHSGRVASVQRTEKAARTFADRGMRSTSKTANEARRTLLRGLISAVLAHAGQDGAAPADVIASLATRARRSELEAEAQRMKRDGLLVHTGAGSAHRWYLAAGKAAA